MSPENEEIQEVQDDEQEEEFVAVEDDAEEDEQEEEARLGAGREEEDDDDDKRERRRSENKSRRQRQKEARDRTERELNFLRTRNEQLEQRFSHFEQETDARIAGGEIANIDQSINKARADLQLANTVIQQAVEMNDGKNLAEALDHRDTIRDNLRDLEEAKGYLAQPRQRGGGDYVQQQLDPRHVAHAQKFMMDHDWWDPAGRDQDSQRVLEIDRQLVNEGFNPTHKDYWDELRARTEEAVPARFGGEGNGQEKPRSRNKGPQFRTGGRERPLKKNQVYISAERKEAMIEAGVWDDPVLRNKYLKSYAEWDKQAQEGA